MSRCPKGKILNPATGRCVNRDGKIGKMLLSEKGKGKENGKNKGKNKGKEEVNEAYDIEKKLIICPKDKKKIVNPKSKRCVSRNGKIGKFIIESIRKGRKNDESFIEGDNGEDNGEEEKGENREGKNNENKRRDKKCPPNKIVNPVSSRCVLRKGKIGRIILKNRKENRQGRGEKDNRKEKDDEKGLIIEDLDEINEAKWNNEDDDESKLDIELRNKYKASIEDLYFYKLAARQDCPEGYYLDDIDDIDEEQGQGQACVEEGSEKGKYIIQKYIDKRLGNPLSSQFFEGLESVVGLASLRIYKDSNSDKVIYSLGELHDSKNYCPGKNNIHIVDYLEKILAYHSHKNKDVIFDIFSENDYISKEYPTRQKLNSTPLMEFNRRMDSCFQIDKKLCRYKNARFHYADMRIPEITPVPANIFHAIDMIRYNVVEESDYTPVSFNKLIGADELKFLYSLIDDTEKRGNGIDIQEAICKLTSKYPHKKIEKNVMNIKSKSIRDKLVNFYDRLKCKDVIYKFSLQTLKKIVEFIKYKLTHPRVSFSEQHNVMREMGIKDEDIYTFNDIISNVFSSTMDIYLLARLFRTYSDGSEAKYSIIFSGDYHNHIYNEFFTTIGFIPVRKVESNFRCIKLEKGKKIWFEREINEERKRGGNDMEIEMI